MKRLVLFVAAVAIVAACNSTPPTAPKAAPAHRTASLGCPPNSGMVIWTGEDGRVDTTCVPF